MPTYEYACSACGEHLEVVQSFTDDPLVRCPACGKRRLRKVFAPIGVVFKGSGFYKTDSRTSGRTAASPAADTGSAATDTPAKTDAPAKSETAAATTKDKPADKPAATPKDGGKKAAS